MSSQPFGKTGDQETPQVHSITNAQASLTDDMSHRQRVYYIQMSIRVVCFLLAVFIPHWSRWIFAVGAVFLPYFAVIGANTKNTRSEPAPDVAVKPVGLPNVPLQESPQRSVVVEGEIIEAAPVNARRLQAPSPTATPLYKPPVHTDGSPHVDGLDGSRQ